MILTSMINAVLAIAFAANFAESKPMSVSRYEEANAVSYMVKYGYLNSRDGRLGRLRTIAELEIGIKRLQRFGGIVETGRIDAATVALIRKPRCGIPDFGPTDNTKRRRRYAAQGSMWEKNNLTYRLLNTATRNINKAMINATIRTAFAMWAEVTPLTFKEIFDGVADIMISFEAGLHDDGYPFDGQGGTLGHGFYPRNNLGLSGDIHFDDDETWELGTDDGTDFMWTAVHEIGHALGLYHSYYSDSIMFSYYQGYKPNIKLQEDDILGIQSIYGKPTLTPPTIPTKGLMPKPMDGPSPCMSSFDAVFHSKDGNTYFFKEHNFWKLDQYNRVSEPLKIAEHWPHLRKKVQAAYTRRDGKTVFFKGRRYWVYEGTKYIEGPKLITDNYAGLPLKRLDAVFVWAGNGQTYFFKGHEYWRYNEMAKSVDSGYPKNISEGWGAIPTPIDSVMKWKDGNSYFFHGLTVQQYNFRTRYQYEPENTGHYFMGCSETGAAMQDGVARTSVLTPVLILAFLTAIVNV